MSSASVAACPPMRAASASASSPRHMLRKTWMKGQYDGAPPTSEARPQCTETPRPATERESSSASRVLPIPGSPVMRNRPPRPASRSTTPLSSSASSASRPRQTRRDAEAFRDVPKEWHSVPPDFTPRNQETSGEAWSQVHGTTESQRRSEMSIQALRDFIQRHNTASAGLAALGAALDAKISGPPLDPAVAARVDELVTALGGSHLLDDVSRQQAAPFLAEIRFSLGMDAKLPYAHTRGTSWSVGDPQILQAVGEFARVHADGLTHKVIPGLEGLAARFAGRDAAFLDIGVGVAGTAIAMAEQL